MRKAYEDELKGRTVIDGEGRAIGEIDGVFVDTDGWSVDAVRVRVRTAVARELGLPHGVFHSAVLDVPASLLQAATDTILLKVAARDLRPAEAHSSEPVH
jgi:sporulation protein YlmC with PRC-barrel domain